MSDVFRVEMNAVASDCSDDEMSPEEIARILAAMERSEPLELTDQELADWEATRQARKDWAKSQFADRAEKLRRMWD